MRTRLTQMPARRRRPARRVAVICATVAALVAVLSPLGATGVAGARSRPDARKASLSTCPWLDESLSIAARVKLLMSQMTLTDKIAEMHAVPGAPTGPEATYESVVPAQPALCIPALTEQDGPSGVAAGANGVTQLPSEVSLGSAWDPSLAYQYGALNGQQHWEQGIAMALAPGINIQRDPRWGRNFEMFSEDPLLTGALGSADIDGIQSQHVMADVKHLVAYNQETFRSTEQEDVVVSKRALHEIYLPPFYSAVTQADAASIMCSYASLNGQYSCQDEGLLTQLVDRRWGFAGFFRSDNGSNHSTVASANAGLDQERGSNYWDNGLLAAAVAAGKVKVSTIDDAVRRVLTEMFRFDLFDNPPTGTLNTPVDNPAADAFARFVAERGTVLLQNTAHSLPLSTATSGSIAVIGSDGTTNPLTTGGGSSFVRPPYLVSPLTGITNRAGPGATVTSYSGDDPTAAAATAQGAHVAIVFASQRESEGTDRKSLSLPDDQNAMIEAVAAANPNTIVVLNTGGPVLMPWRGQVKGILEAWYPGQEDGNAIASVLFGDTDPSGHLTETFPTSLSQVPTKSPLQFPGDGTVHYSEGLDVGYRAYDARHITPLFPFGYGLSYTSFKFSHLTVSPRSLLNFSSGPDAPAGQGDRLARVTARVTNTGSVPGSDVVQLYLGDPKSAKEPPRQLEGFARVTLMPGQSRTVTLPITGHELSYFNDRANGWTLPDGRFSVYVGDSSALGSLPLRGALRVTETIGSRYAKLRAPATVDPGATFTAGMRIVNHGDIPLTGATVHLQPPRGWTVVRTAGQPRLTLRAGQSTTRYFRVTAPEQAQNNVTTLTARVASAGRGDAGDLSATASTHVLPGITVTPSTTTAADPGQSVPATVTLTNNLDQAATLTLTPTSLPGVAVGPVPATVSVPAHGTISLPLTVSVAAGQPAGTYQIPLNPSYTDALGTGYLLSPAELPVTVP